MNNRIVNKIPDYIPPKIEDYGLVAADEEIILAKKKELERLKEPIPGCAIILFGNAIFIFLLSSCFWVSSLNQFMNTLAVIAVVFFVLQIIEWIFKLDQKYKYNKFLGEYKETISAFDKYQEAIAISKNQYSSLLQRMKQIEKEYWLSLDGFAFEEAIAGLFRKAGLIVELTSKTGDHGIDLNLYDNRTRTIVQCKAHKKPVGPKDVRELYGVLMANDDVYDAILITTNGATRGAHEFVKGKPIVIWDIEDILRYVNKYG